MARDHAIKNHRNDKNHSQGKRMYELKNSILCPYRSFLSYIYKLNLDIAVLLQRPSEENQPKNDKMLSLGQNKEYFQKNSTFKELQTTIWAQRLSHN